MFGVRVSWIGWEFNMAAMSVSLQPTKRSKLLDLIDRLRRRPRASVKDLERFIGLALWACNLFPVMKSQLHYLYKDLFSPGASHFSVGPDYWPEVKDCLRQDLRFLFQSILSCFRFATKSCPAWQILNKSLSRISDFGCVW